MELNREQIIKALECCIKAESWGDCEDLGCPAHTKQGCYFYLRTDDDYENTIYIELCKDALSLIKELTEENERLRSKGEWVDQYNGKYDNPIYVCSVCQRGTLLKPYIDDLGNMKMEQALSEFCPRCGAKMKGGE